MGKKREDPTAEVMAVLTRIIRARPDGVLEALREGKIPDELEGVASVKCKQGADGGCEWEVKLADRLKAIELFLKYRDGSKPEEAAGSPGVVVDYDYG